jgi:hypothetical protein
VQTAEELTTMIQSGTFGSPDAAAAFFATQQGAVDRMMDAIKLATQHPE